MKYYTIVLLNLASILEAIIIKVGIDQGIILYYGTGQCSRLHEIIALVAVKNILLLGGYQIYFWVQRNHNPKRRILLPTSAWDLSLIHI